jgi:acyl carrier protein
MDAKAAPQGILVADKVRALIVEYLDIDAKQVTDEAHFGDDLGIDWLDQLELLILVEEQFPDVRFSDSAVKQIEVVGDLLRYIETANQVGSAQNQQNAVLVFRKSAA